MGFEKIRAPFYFWEFIDWTQKVKNKLSDLKVSLTSKEVTQVMQKYHKAIQQQKDPGTSRALLNNFVNKLTISSEKLTIEFKVNFCDMIGAGEGT